MLFGFVLDRSGSGSGRSRQEFFFMSGAGGFVASMHEGFDLEIRQLSLCFEFMLIILRGDYIVLGLDY